MRGFPGSWDPGPINMTPNISLASVLLSSNWTTGTYFLPLWPPPLGLGSEMGILLSLLQ